MYGDGSDGAYLAAAGNNTLDLDVKHQFTTFNVPVGATIRPTLFSNGSVLYICATTSITIDGSIILQNTLRGHQVLSVTIDGDLYTSPGVANGGAGGNGTQSRTGGSQSNGFGGGGAGGHFGGNGGNGGSSAGSGGSGGTAGPVGSGGVDVSGNNGGVSSGGGGGAYSSLFGGGSSGSGTGGTGGSAYGANGGNGSASGASGGGASLSGGGGGAGGNAGISGIHLVLRSPIITITGTIETKGIAGLSGGAGGNPAYSNTSSGQDRRGSGGGGGGGGNAGDLYLFYEALTEGTYIQTGGAGGSGGTGYEAGGSGTTGSDGEVFRQNLAPAQPYQGPFARVWNGTEWVYAKPTAYEGTRFAEPKIVITE